MEEQPGGLICRPIGYLRCGRNEHFLVPSQPGQEASTDWAWVELLPDHHFEVALSDLQGFSRIWLVWWFHRHKNWRPKVLPPRGRSGRKGLFATRSPHRPNPIGLSSVTLLGIEGRKLYIGAHDMLDGTPVLDIKPYLPEFDAFPLERSGWLEELPICSPFRVEVNETSQRRLEWLDQNHHPDFSRRVREILSQDPYPHRTRRILEVRQGRYRLSSGPWRIFFHIRDDSVMVDEIRPRPGLPDIALD